MATATKSDFQIYHAEFQAGLWESLSQNTTAFNAASRGALRMVTEDLRGDYEKRAFFQTITNLVTRRDVTSTSAATAVKPTQEQVVGVKVNRKIGPVEWTIDALRKIGSNPQQMSFILGQQVAEAKLADFLNTAVLAAEAAIQGQTAMNLDVTGETTKTMITDYLAQALALMGDQAERVVAWVMHSKVYWNLVRSQISDKIVNVADRVVYGGSPATLNRPVVISDIAALTDANGSATDTYNTLGLVTDGVVLTESEQSDMLTETVTGNENLIVRVQGEYAYNLRIKGFAWDITNGGAAPTDAALATTTNWDKVAASNKGLAGVRIVSQ